MFNVIKDKLQDLGESFFKKMGEGDYGTSSRSYIDDAYRQMSSFYKACDLFPYETYDESSQLFINDESIGFVLETSPLVGSSIEMQKELSNLFQSVLPEESGIQFLMWADPHIGDQCDLYARSREGRGEILETLARQRADYLKSFAFESPHKPFTLRNFRCLISFNRAFLKNKTFLTEETAQILMQVKTTLESVGMQVSVWRPEDLIRTLDGILHLNPQQTNSSHYRWNQLQRLSDQLFSGDSNLLTTKGALFLNDGKAEARVFRVKQYPEVWSLHAMGMLIGDEQRNLMQIPCPFLMHYGIYIPKQDGHKTKVIAKARYVERQANSPIGKYLPSIQREAQELEYVRSQLEKGGRIVHTQFTVTLMGIPGEMTKAEQILQNYFVGKEWHLNKEVFLGLPLFLTSLPLMWGAQRVKELNHLQTLKTTLSTESENLLPLQGEWKGTRTPGMMLAGRRGQLFSWFPFDNNTGNFSVAVVGKSGSGKSVFMQELMSSTLGMGGKVFVMDLGRSFEKTCSALGGQYIQFTPNTDMCLNPFSSIPMGDPEEEQDALGMLKSVLSLMASPSGLISDIEAAMLEQAMNETWRAKGNQSTINDIAEKLLSDPHGRANDLGKMLFPYTTHGNYGRYFNGVSNVNLNNRLLVIEFSDLDARKELKAVIVQAMMMKITDQLYKSDRKYPNMLIVDEASDSLQSKLESELYSKAARRVRKYEGSIVFGTQTVNDFFATKDAEAAFSNCDTKCYFNQNAEDLQLLKKSDRLNVTPHQESLLTSLRTNQGKYGEVMIINPNGYAVGRLILDPFSLLLYSTKGEEYSAVKAMMDQGIPVKQAIEMLIQKQELAV